LRPGESSENLILRDVANSVPNETIGVKVK
jgi:hypothetical protein